MVGMWKIILICKTQSLVFTQSQVLNVALPSKYLKEKVKNKIENILVLLNYLNLRENCNFF